MVTLSEKVLAVIQARVSSTRLSGKVLKNLNEKPLILHIVERLKRASTIDEIIVATSTHPSDDTLVDVLKANDCSYFRGSLEDVLSRYVGAISFSKASTIIRVTADCPLVMPTLVDEMVGKFQSLDSDYLSNTILPTFPDGLDLEIFTREALLRLNAMELTSQEREHVTLGMRNRSDEFLLSNYNFIRDLSGLRWTVDYPEDLRFIREVYSHFKGRESTFGFEEILELLSTGLVKATSISSTRRNEALRPPN